MFALRAAYNKFTSATEKQSASCGTGAGLPYVRVIAQEVIHRSSLPAGPFQIFDGQISKGTDFLKVLRFFYVVCTVHHIAMC